VPIVNIIREKMKYAGEYAPVTRKPNSVDLDEGMLLPRMRALIRVQEMYNTPKRFSLSRK
jgi:hypothetical protein